MDHQRTETFPPPVFDIAETDVRAMDRSDAMSRKDTKCGDLDESNAADQGDRTAVPFQFPEAVFMFLSVGV